MMVDSEQVADLEGAEMVADPLAKAKRRVADRENQYQQQGRLRRGQLLSPERKDAFN
jgi:hypothetical protein